MSRWWTGISRDEFDAKHPYPGTCSSQSVIQAWCDEINKHHFDIFRPILTDAGWAAEQDIR